MMTGKQRRLIAGVVVGLMGVLWAAQPRAVVPIVVTTTQLTTNTFAQIDPEISGNTVVWTDQRNLNDDVYACDLTDCAATEVAVFSSSVAERLNAISGNIVVTTRIEGPARTIQAYDLATNTPLGQIGVGNTHQNPSIDGSLVAFENGPVPISQVSFANLANPAVMTTITSTGMNISPSVDTGRIAYESHATTSSPGDLFMYTVATGVTTAIETSASIDARRPQFDGDVMVFDGADTPGAETDIFIHRISTATTTRLTLPGNQRNPHVSGDVVVFDDDGSGSPDVTLYHIPTGTLQVIAGTDSAEFLNRLDGNRVVYNSNAAGNLDVWMVTFTVQLPEIDVTPMTHDFGDVNVGTTQATVVTVSNVGSQPLHVTGASFTGGSSGAFGLTAPVPAAVQAGSTIDLSVTFTPGASGTAGALLQIFSDDLDEPLVVVALTGAGVQVAPPPIAQVAALLAFFDQSVTNGTLSGDGPGNSAAGRLGALRNKIEAASDLIRDGLTAQACEQLLDALRRVDGVPQPPDFANGAARLELARRIQELRASLGCG